MYLYNTTFAVDKGLEDELMMWLKADFIPSAIGKDGGEMECKGYFENSDTYRPMVLSVLGGEPGVTSLAVHLYTSSIHDIEDWYADYGSALFSYVMERWNSKIVFFSTTLEVKQLF